MKEVDFYNDLISFNYLNKTILYPNFKVEEAILEKKKKELLSKYVSDELLRSEQELKILSGKN